MAIAIIAYLVMTQAVELCMYVLRICHGHNPPISTSAVGSDVYFIAAEQLVIELRIGIVGYIASDTVRSFSAVLLPFGKLMSRNFYSRIKLFQQNFVQIFLFVDRGKMSI